VSGALWSELALAGVRWVVLAQPPRPRGVGRLARALSARPVKLYWLSLLLNALARLRDLERAMGVRAWSCCRTSARTTPAPAWPPDMRGSVTSDAWMPT